jgi:hypothetical protein
VRLVMYCTTLSKLYAFSSKVRVYRHSSKSGRSALKIGSRELNNFWRSRIYAAFIIFTAALAACTGTSAQGDNPPIHIKRVATGKVEGLKNFAEMTIDACRTAKKLPLNAPKILPPDRYFEELLVTEIDEYFDGSKYASYQTARRVSADPNSDDCKLALFLQYAAWTGELCKTSGFGGSSKGINDMTDYQQPAPPAITWSKEPASASGCSKKPKPYDTKGLRVEDAGLGAQCVWHSDIVAKTAREAGLNFEGHKKDSKSYDLCLYERLPVYFVGGHKELLVLKTAASTEADVMDQIHGESTAYANQRLADFSDGKPIAAEKFSSSAIEAFVSRPIKMALKE